MPRIPQSGFTLVEVMVSAVILGVSISGIMAMLGTGRGLEASESLRRQSRLIAANALEDTLRHYSKYPLVSTADPGTATLINLKSESDYTVAADLFVTVWPITNTTWYEGDSPYNLNRSVEYQKIRAKVCWPSGNVTDSVVLWRRIAQIP